jgi:rhodanese-related sulfurtransferase
VSRREPLVAKTIPGSRSFRGRPVDLVIDVRSKIEYWLGHLDGATCIPVDVVVQRLGERADVEPGMRIMVYCASGARSAAAATALRARGFRHVTDAGAIAAAAPEYKS